MMLGLTDETLSDSSEEEEVGVQQSSSQKPTSSKLSALQSQPPQSIENQPTTSNLDCRRKSTRNKRAKSDQESLLYLCPGSLTEGEVDYSLRESTSKNKRTLLAKDRTEKIAKRAGYQCKIVRCLVAKSSEKDLFEHVRIDHSDRKYRCDVCPMAFKFPCHLYNHNVIHTGDKPYQCDECGMKFVLKFHMQRHQLTIHNEKKLVPCRQQNCGIRVPKNDLFEHIRTAHAKEKFQCDVCPMSFKICHQLTIHKRKHNGNKLYECEVCGKNFSQSGNYKRHYNSSHTGERPFKCDICGKAFTEVANMRLHMMTHTGEKPIPCSFCGKSFRAFSDRNFHEASCSAK
eukprot:sb/3466380/